MNIYNILASKSSKHHLLNRYISFLEQCQHKNSISNPIITEKHHICPKAKDMFPEYSSFKENPWNMIRLTPRQHFISHLMLWKIYPNVKSVTYCLDRMKNTANIKINSKLYENYKIAHSNNRKLLIRAKIEDGSYHMLQKNNPSKIKVDNGTHHFLNGKIQSDINYKKVKNGTHPFLDREKARERALKRIENGDHHFISGEMSKKANAKRIKENTHNFLGFVQCIDEICNSVRITKEEYYSQQEPKKYAHIRSIEGKRRLHVRNTLFNSKN